MYSSSSRLVLSKYLFGRVFQQCKKTEVPRRKVGYHCNYKKRYVMKNQRHHPANMQLTKPTSVPLSFKDWSTLATLAFVSSRFGMKNTTRNNCKNGTVWSVSEFFYQYKRILAVQTEVWEVQSVVATEWVEKLVKRPMSLLVSHLGAECTGDLFGEFLTTLW